MKNKFITLLVIVVLSTGLSATGFNASSAEDAAAEVSVVGTSQNSCPVSIRTQFLEAQTEYFELLELTIESPDLTSDQLNYLYQDFLDFKLSMRAALATGTINLDSSLSNTSVRESCETAYSSVLDQTQDVFTQYVSQVTSRKRTFILNEKYDQIVSGLVDTQELLHDIESNFNTFETQLPCIVEQCIQR